MKTLVFLLLLSQSSVFGAERPEDFAYGMLIHADAQEALYEIEIPGAGPFQLAYGNSAAKAAGSRSIP